MLVEIEVLVDTEKSESREMNDGEEIDLEIVGAEDEDGIEKPEKEQEEVYEKVSINPHYIAGIQEKFGQGVIMMESLYYPKFVLARDSREKVTQQINSQLRR